jgi:surface antigen
VPLPRHFLVVPPVAFALCASFIVAHGPHLGGSSLASQNSPNLQNSLTDTPVRTVLRAPHPRTDSHPATPSRAVIWSHKAPAARPAAALRAPAHPIVQHVVTVQAAQPVVSYQAHTPAPPPVYLTAPAPAPAPAPPPPPPPASTGGDDYPYRYASGSPSDPWGFTERQCVSFVAWRLNQAGQPLNNAANSWGSALTWDDAARSLGRPITTSPSYGTVAQWNAGESSPYYANGSSSPNGQFTAGGYGHVAWVVAVYADGSALVQQYNISGNRSYSTMRVKAPRYLHLR